VKTGVVWVSAESGTGLSELIAAIDGIIDRDHGEIVPELPILTSARHRRAIEAAYAEVQDFERAWGEQRLPATIAAVHLRTAVTVLEELIGSVDIEDVLDRLFSAFCVGK
jgi:tRNA modification GTPase